MADFIDTKKLLHVAEIIASLPPCRLYHRLTADQIMVALAENDIFPECIRADMILDAVEDAEAASGAGSFEKLFAVA
jgi:hypothetical protein